MLHKKYVLMGLLAIIIVALVIRATPLSLYGPLSSSQEIIELLTMKQAIAANYHLVPNLLSGESLTIPISAVHPNNLYAEQGIILMAVYAYWLFGHFIGLINLLSFIHLLFIILSVVVIYLFTFELTEDRTAGMLAGIIYAVSSIGLSIEAFSIWKGEGFVPVLLVTSILLILYSFKEKHRLKSLGWSILAAITAIFGIAIWNGGVYIIAAVLFVYVALILSKYIKSKKRLLICMTGLIIIMTLILFGTNLDAKFAIVPIQNIQEPYANISITKGIILNAAQVLSQIQPTYPQINEFYFAFLSKNFLVAKIPYLIWIIIGFITTTLLMLITLIKFSFHEAKHKKEAFIALTMLVLLGLPIALFSSSWWTLLIFIPICILAGGSYSYIKKHRILILIIITLLLASFAISIIQAKLYNFGPVPQFGEAASWIYNNTPQNAKFITMPSDGSAIEYLDNRVSYIDTDQSSSPSAIAQVASFFFAKAYNFSFLNQINYSYVLVEQDWASPAGSGYIALDGNLPANTLVNGTNLGLLDPQGPWGTGGLNGSYSNTGITLKEVYNANGILIYKVQK